MRLQIKEIMVMVLRVSSPCAHNERIKMMMSTIQFARIE
jgi:hypothetical protein